MLVIEHGNKSRWYDLKKYKTRCSCGCIFECNENEFIKEKMISKKDFIFCPDCGKTIYKENMKEIKNVYDGFWWEEVSM